MDRLVLEQFMICMPLECQVLLKESGVQSCKDLEDVLKNKQKPKTWVSRTLMMGVGQGDTCKLQGSQDRTSGFCSVSVVPKQVREVHSWAIWEILLLSQLEGCRCFTANGSFYCQCHWMPENYIPGLIQTDLD